MRSAHQHHAFRPSAFGLLPVSVRNIFYFRIPAAAKLAVATDGVAAALGRVLRLAEPPAPCEVLLVVRLCRAVLRKLGDLRAVQAVQAVNMCGG